MTPKCGPVTVKAADGSITQADALNDYQLRQVNLPKSQRKKANDRSDVHGVDYERYLKSNKWNARKRSYFSQHRKKCRACGSKEDIHLHHLTYERLGCERDSDLAPLCQKCHTKVHQLHSVRAGRISLRAVTRNFIADRSAGRSTSRRYERLKGSKSGRLPGERRERQCGPGLKKPPFIPANRRALGDPVNRALNAIDERRQ